MWLTILTPAGAWLWPVRGDEQLEGLEALINAARIQVGFPPSSTWVTDGSGFRVEIGEPGAAVMARATVGTVEELRAADPAAVAAYADARRAAKARARIEVVKAAFRALDAAGRAEVVAAGDAAPMVRGR